MAVKDAATDRPPEQGRAFGVGVLGLFFALLAVSLIDLQLGPLEPGYVSVCLGLYMMLIGAAALGAYHWPHRSFIFRWMIWITRRNKNDGYSIRKAIFIAGLTWFGGVMALLKGLGLT